MATRVTSALGEEVALGAETGFGQAGDGFVQHGLEDGHGEGEAVALELREDVFGDADDDVLA